MGDGFLSKMEVLVGIEDAEDDELEVEEEMASLPERKPLDPHSASVHKEGENKEARVVSMAPRVTTANQFSNQFKMLVIEPKSFEECPRLVDSLKAKKPVIINLEKIESDTGRKIFDFLSGATYALNGNVQKVANNIFIFAPENVEVSIPLEPKTGFGDKNNGWR